MPGHAIGVRYGVHQVILAAQGNRQDDFEVLEESPTWVRCFVGVGHEANWESMSLYWIP